MKLKGFFLLILISISAIALSVTGFYNRNTVYASYMGEYTDGPFLSVVFTGAADRVFPWSPVKEQPKPSPSHEKEDEADKPVEEDKADKPVKKEFIQVEDSYFDDALFVGDSRMVGLSEYCQPLDERATFYAKKSLTIYDIRDKNWIKTEDGRKITLWDALAERQYSKIYIMVGINELGIGDQYYFRDAYKEVVDRILEEQPNAVVFINSIMNVSQEKSEADPLYNNENIFSRNQAIRDLEDKQRVFYLNINEAVTDSRGFLNADWTSDGIHLKGAYYEPWHEYLLQHGVKID